jgi:hypothetical protein
VPWTPCCSSFSSLWTPSARRTDFADAVLVVVGAVLVVVGAVLLVVVGTVLPVVLPVDAVVFVGDAVLLVADAGSARRVTPFCFWTPLCSSRTPFCSSWEAVLLVTDVVLPFRLSWTLVCSSFCLSWALVCLSVLRIVDTVLLVVDAPFCSSLCCGRHSDAVVLVLGSGSARRGRRRGRRCARRGFLPSLCTKNHGTPRNTKTTKGRPYESSRRCNASTSHEKIVSLLGPRCHHDPRPGRVLGFISSQSISGATGSRSRDSGASTRPRVYTKNHEDRLPVHREPVRGPFLPSLCTGNHEARCKRMQDF